MCPNTAKNKCKYTAILGQVVKVILHKTNFFFRFTIVPESVFIRSLNFKVFMKRIFYWLLLAFIWSRNTIILLKSPKTNCLTIFVLDRTAEL